MIHMKGYKKGQITMVSLLSFVFTCFTYFMFAPIINDAGLPVVAYFLANPNPVSAATIFLIYSLPFVALLAIFLSIINQALPTREVYR
jgi:hypothetical protein